MPRLASVSIIIILLFLFLHKYKVSSLRDFFLKIDVEVHKDMVAVHKGLTPLSLVAQETGIGLLYGRARSCMVVSIES